MSTFQAEEKKEARSRNACMREAKYFQKFPVSICLDFLGESSVIWPLLASRNTGQFNI